jgi:hypothetical protein
VGKLSISGLDLSTMRFRRQLAWILTAGSVQLLAFSPGSSYAAGSTVAAHTPGNVLPYTASAFAKSQAPTAPLSPNIHTLTSVINHPSMIVHTSNLQQSSFNPAYLPNLLSHLNLNLGSTVHSLSAQLLNPILKNNVMLTPAEFLSMALGHNGSSLQLGSKSEAVSGTIVLPPGLTSLSSLIIPAGVTVVDRAPALTIGGTLSNSGTILVVGSTGSHSVISAADIVNSGTISADPSISMSLNAVGSFNNSGTIHANNLTIQSPNISNSGILSATAGQLSLNTNLLNNSGIIQSSQSINISALDSSSSSSSSSSLLINQSTAGLISAGSSMLCSSANDLSIKGGMLSAQTISLNAPNGKLSVNLQDIQGLLDVNAQCASFNVSSGKHGLNIHSFNVTGDPNLIYVGSGPFVSAGFNSDGGDVIIDTSQDEQNGSITFTGTIDTTPASSGNGGKVILFAGTTLNVANVDTNANGQGDGGLIELQAYGNISDGTLVANGQTGNGAIVVTPDMPIPQVSNVGAGTLTISGQPSSPSPPPPPANIGFADEALPQLNSQTNFYQASTGVGALSGKVSSYDAPLKNEALEEQAAPLSQLFVFDGTEGPQVIGFENSVNDLQNVFLLSKPSEKTNGRITASIKQIAEHTIAINGVDSGKASLELTENLPPTINWQQGRFGFVCDRRCVIRANLASVEIPGKSIVIIDSPDKNSLRISNLGGEDAAVTVSGQIITVASNHELLIEQANTNPAESDGLKRSITNRTSRNGMMISELSLNGQIPASALIAACPTRCTSLRVKRSLSDAKASVQKTLMAAVSASRKNEHSSFSPIAAVNAPAVNTMGTRKMRTNNCQLHYLSDPSFIMDGDNLHLHEGELLVSADKPTSIKTANAQINLPAHTLALLKSKQEVLRVYTIWGHGAGAVKVVNDGQEHRVATGEELLLAPDSSTVSELIEADLLGRRRLNLFESSREAGCLAEVSMVSLIQSSPLLQSLVKGIDPASRCMAEKIKKISACISITSAAHGPFSR